MKEHNIEFRITEADFEMAVGRKPKSQEEMEEFYYFIKRAVENNLDWDIIYKNAKIWIDG